MTAPITVGEQVAIRDVRQLGSDWTWYFDTATGPWFLTAVEGVAARIGCVPNAPVTIVTPVSNLRRAEVA